MICLLKNWVYLYIMAAARGNKYYLNVLTKTGKPLAFKSANHLAIEAAKYFEHEERAKWHKIQPMVVSDGQGMGSSVEKVKVPLLTPFTMKKLCLFLGVNEEYFRDFKRGVRGQQKEFAGVIAKIEDIVYSQQYDGAATGIFNGNIISRALGLIDKTQNENTNFNSIPLSKEELKQLNDELESEV